MGWGGWDSVIDGTNGIRHCLPILMRFPTLSNYMRAALFAGLGTAAYLTGSWQGMVSVKARPVPRAHNAASLELAARVARAKTYAEFLSTLIRHSSAQAAGIDLAKDLKGGLEKLAKLTAGQNDKGIYSDAFADWAKDPKAAPAAAAAALALPDGDERAAALSGVTSGWDESDAKSCLDWASSLPSTDADILKNAVMTVATQQNDSRQPALAAQYVDKFQDISVRNQVIGDIGIAWGSGSWGNGQSEGTDPAAALAWLDQVALGDRYDSTVNFIFMQMSKDNPSNAATLVDEVTDPVARESAITNVAEEWVKDDPAAALAWVQNLPDSEKVRNDALAQMIPIMAAEDPAAAAALLQNSSIPAASQPVEPIMNSWAAYEPQAALAWAGNLPDGDTKNNALDAALATMSASNLTGAWNYAANLTANDPASPVMGDLVSTLAKSNPSQAAAMLGQLPTDAAQLDATGNVATAWAPLDPQGFAKWVNSLPPGPQHDKAVKATLDALNDSPNFSYPNSGGRDLPQSALNAFVKSLTQAIQEKPTP